ncbi:hypothetical protein KKB55_15060 [Myxococcota bacterium]|nr:hypothetical protein [Myxococcota bacterium]MBU1899058.1 hypothetical protein [Myxococcota bacterium]
MNDPSLRALLFDLDGHLTDLSLDRLLYEPLDVEIERALRAHIEGCEACRARQAEIQAQDAASSFAPPSTSRRGDALGDVISDVISDVIDLAAVRRRRRAHLGAWLGGVFALAAALVLFVQPRPEPLLPAGPALDLDGVRLKGGAFEMEVYADDQPGGRLLEDGAVVYPGVRLGFTVWARRAGHAMIVGWDQRDEIYPCWPDDGPAPLAASPKAGAPRAVDSAVVLDETLGAEHLIGVYCPHDFTLVDLRAALRAAGAPHAAKGAWPALKLPKAAGRCAWTWLTLEKQARAPQPSARPTPAL